MRRASRRAVLAGLLVPVAGCGGLLPDRAGRAGRRSDAPRTTGTEPGEPREPTATESATASPVAYPVNDVLLTVPEVGSGYSLVGETVRSLATSTGERRTVLEERGIRLGHERSFQPDGDTANAPGTVFCSVTVYTDAAAAERGRNRLVDAIVSSGGEARRVEVLSGYESTVVRFRNDRDDRNVLFVRLAGPVVYYVVVSDPDASREEFGRNMLAAMIADAPE